MVTPTRPSSGMLMQIPSPEDRSISSFSTSPSRDFRGLKFFEAISRKLARKSRDDLNSGGDADSRSSSTDSCSSTSVGGYSQPKKDLGSRLRSASQQRMSSSSSDTESDTQSMKHKRSISVESFRKVFQNLMVTSERSQGCNSGKEGKRKTVKKSPPKRILRSPVTYVYLKGVSGLPTQRVPKSQYRVCVNGTCGCGVRYVAGKR